MNPRTRIWLLFLLGGILMGISWPFTGSLTPLIFVAWWPFLYAEAWLTEKRWRPRKLLLRAYVGFLVFNLVTTWWIYYASAGGMIMAVMVNAFLMTITFYLFHLIHRRMGNFVGYSAFVSLWLAFELAHYHWEFSWPWLNLGNVFSIRTTWVQWYEFTGTGGGTLWILLVNLLGFFTFRTWLAEGMSRRFVVRKVYLLLLIGIPVLFSVIIYNRYKEEKNPVDVVVVQPNIDPYQDKFRGMNAFDQLTVFFRNAFSVADSNTRIIIGPETVLPYCITENKIDERLEEASGTDEITDEFSYLQRILKALPKTEMCLGMYSRSVFPDAGSAPANAQQEEDGTWTEYYNSALFISPSLHYSVYHKKHLVLGVEKIPFASWFPVMNRLAMSMGGSSQTLGASAGPEIFHSELSPVKAAGAICYESVYGGHLAEAARKGANVLFVMTNDGWWRDTPGYKQHMSYARLRAVELRRSVARSANTGISCFINQRGDVETATTWWVSTALRRKINLNENLTIYARTGDVVYWLACCIAMGNILVCLYFWFTGKWAGEFKEI